jgi:hypothetical protein
MPHLVEPGLRNNAISHWHYCLISKPRQVSMSEHKPKQDLPSLEEVRRWRRLFYDCRIACVEYIQSAEGFNHILRLAEAHRRYEKLGLL